MAKGKKEFELTVAVWQNASEQLPAGTVVVFDDDEPTGIFVGRVKELTARGKTIEVASPSVGEGLEETAADAVVPTPPAPAPKK